MVPQALPAAVSFPTLLAVAARHHRVDQARGVHLGRARPRRLLGEEGLCGELTRQVAGAGIEPVTHLDGQFRRQPRICLGLVRHAVGQEYPASLQPRSHSAVQQQALTGGEASTNVRPAYGTLLSNSVPPITRASGATIWRIVQ